MTEGTLSKPQMDYEPNGEVYILDYLFKVNCAEGFWLLWIIYLFLHELLLGFKRSNKEW